MIGFEIKFAAIRTNSVLLKYICEFYNIHRITVWVISLWEFTRPHAEKSRSSGIGVNFSKTLVSITLISPSLNRTDPRWSKELGDFSIALLLNRRHGRA